MILRMLVYSVAGKFGGQTNLLSVVQVFKVFRMHCKIILNNIFAKQEARKFRNLNNHSLLPLMESISGWQIMQTGTARKSSAKRSSTAAALVRLTALVESIICYIVHIGWNFSGCYTIQICGESLFLTLQLLIMVDHKLTSLIRPSKDLQPPPVYSGEIVAISGNLCFNHQHNGVVPFVTACTTLHFLKVTRNHQLLTFIDPLRFGDLF